MTSLKQCILYDSTYAKFKGRQKDSGGRHQDSRSIWVQVKRHTGACSAAGDTLFIRLGDVHSVLILSALI